MQKQIPEFIYGCLPTRMRDELSALPEPIRRDSLSEVRIRLDAPASLTCGGENIPLEFRCGAGELSECVTRLCRGSVYAHGETLREGYIRVGEGIRVGVSGVMSESGSITEITSLNLRIPHIIRGVGEPMLRKFILGEAGRLRSTLIYSAPGVGKTTLLRDIAATLGSRCKKRVAVIDTRGELYLPEMFRDTLCDFLTGSARARAIETVTRVLSPEVLICDELGDEAEARAILSAQNSGVPLIASAHAASSAELLRRPNIRLLYDSGVFDCLIGVTRERAGGRLSRCFLFHADECGELVG